MITKETIAYVARQRKNPKHSRKLDLRIKQCEYFATRTKQLGEYKAKFYAKMAKKYKMADEALKAT